MSLGEFDRTGRRRPVEIEGSNFIVDVDMVILAISQRPDMSVLPERSGVETTRWSTVVVDPRTLATGEPGVFAGGDCVHGPDTVIQAIADGRRAAIEIDKYLGGTGEIPVSPNLGRELVGESNEEHCQGNIQVCYPLIGDMPTSTKWLISLLRLKHSLKLRAVSVAT